MWRDLIMERVTKSADACLTALNIMTSARMPKAVYIEDVIERVVQYTKFHLQNTLYPQYDPVYRVNPHGGQCSTLIHCPYVQYPFYSVLEAGPQSIVQPDVLSVALFIFFILSNYVVPPTVKFIGKNPFPFNMFSLAAILLYCFHCGLKNCLMLETLLIKTRCLVYLPSGM